MDIINDMFKVVLNWVDGTLKDNESNPTRGNNEWVAALRDVKRSIENIMRFL